MSYLVQRQLIESHFKAQWESKHPEIPIAWQNVKNNGSDSGFVRISILNGGSYLKGLGDKKLYRYTGVISVDFYLPTKVGMKDVDTYCDTVNDIFLGKTFNNIQCRSPSRSDLGVYNNHWRTNVSISFWRDEII